MVAELAIAQLSVPVRKEHHTKVATLRDELETAIRGLQAQDEEEAAKAKVRRCRLSMKEVGSILIWIFDNKSWSEDGQHRTFADFYKREGLNKQHVERLMKYAGAHDGIDDEVMHTAFPDGMSTRNSQALARVPEEDRNEVVREAAKSKNTSARLNELTQSLRLATPVATVNEGESPKQPKAKPDSGVSWVQRQVTQLLTWFEKRGMHEEAALCQLGQLKALAEQAETKSPGVTS